MGRPPSMPAVAQRRASGFTLIELLIVLGVIGLLVTAFMPAISKALGRGDEAETSARMTALVSMLEGFERVYGFYPPDDATVFGERIPGMQIKKGNSTNVGIESVVIYLSWEDKGNARLAENEDWLANTDEDQNDVTIPLLERKAKMEVVDAWGTPFAYFSAKTGSGYAGSQQVKLGAGSDVGGETIVAKPYKNPRSDGYLGPHTYQLISAGPDGLFNSEDDIVHPALPLED